MATASVAATAAVTAAALAAAAVCECRALLRGRPQEGEQQTPTPAIAADAPEVRCDLKGHWSSRCSRRLSIVKDLLLIGRRPGPPDYVVPLSGAQVTLQGTSVMVIPRQGPPLTLWFGSGEEAQRWAASLRSAAQPQPQPQPVERALSQAGSPDRAQAARIAELEARVSATLNAAVGRSKRIKELEVIVEKGKEREQRIQQLESAVQQSAEEATARGERIKQLEAAIADKKEGMRDPVACAVLEDAMRFAESMLSNRQEEMAIDGNSAKGLQEAVGAVQEAKPSVEPQVAELVTRLVSALRWPMVLRKRLANAEQTVKEQKAIQDQTQSELNELQQQNAAEAAEKLQARQEVSSLQRQLAVAEQAAEDSQVRLAALQNKKTGEQDKAAGRVQELIDFQERLAAEGARRKQAEDKAVRLRKSLVAAEDAAQEGVARQRALLNASKAEEIDTLHRRHAETEAQKVAAQSQAAELRGLLSAAEAAADEAAARKAEGLDEATEKELRALREQLAETEARRLQGEADAEALRELLAAAKKDAPGAEAIPASGAAREEELRERLLAAETALEKARQQASLDSSAPQSPQATSLREAELERRIADMEREQGAWKQYSPVNGGVGGDPGFLGSVQPCSPRGSSRRTLETLLAGAEGAAEKLKEELGKTSASAEKLKEMQHMAINEEFKVFSSPQRVKDTKKELEQRLAAAEQAIGRIGLSQAAR